MGLFDFFTTKRSEPEQKPAKTTRNTTRNTTRKSARKAQPSIPPQPSTPLRRIPFNDDFTIVAENGLYGLFDETLDRLVIPVGFDNIWSCSSDYAIIQQHGNGADSHNRFDYSNNFFKMIDTIGVKSATAYFQATRNADGLLARFLNRRSYTDNDYLCDIIGTQYLRRMQYGEAAGWFSRIKGDADAMLNTTPYYRYDPFGVWYETTDNRSNFKLRFARDMYALELAISNSSDPNTKAGKMVRMALGIRNSFGYCWPLTQYYYGYFPDSPDWTDGQQRAKALARSE